MFTSEHFFPTPAFSQRVQQVGNAGISLTNVQVQDSGNYSVMVGVTEDSKPMVTLRRTVSVLVHGKIAL